jgi:hypothetical protein
MTAQNRQVYIGIPGRFTPEWVAGLNRNDRQVWGVIPKIVAARRESLAELPDALKTIPAVGGGVLLIVEPTEIIEVFLEDGMQIVPTARHVPFGRDRLRESCCPHIYSCGGNKLPASRNPRNHRWPHNIAHSPDAFSSLRSCEGAGDAVVMPLQVVVIFPIAIAFSPRYPSNDDVCRYRWERTDRSVEVVTG